MSAYRRAGSVAGTALAAATVWTLVGCAGSPPPVQNATVSQAPAQRPWGSTTGTSTLDGLEMTASIPASSALAGSVQTVTVQVSNASGFRQAVGLVGISIRNFNGETVYESPLPQNPSAYRLSDRGQEYTVLKLGQRRTWTFSFTVPPPGRYTIWARDFFPGFRRVTTIGPDLAAQLRFTSIK